MSANRLAWNSVPTAHFISRKCETTVCADSGLNFHVSDQLGVHREQDFQAIVSQGALFDRTTERLATSDEGVILFRKMVMEGIRAVDRGEDPIGVRRDGDPEAIIDLKGDVIDGLNQLEKV